MRVAIVSDPPDLSAYVGEILKTWGLAFFEVVGADSLSSADPAEVPVVICPAAPAGRPASAALVQYAGRGGTVICFLPSGGLAEAAGLSGAEEKETPLRLRLTDQSVPGLAGELLPVVGRAASYRLSPAVAVKAYLCHPGRCGGESAGLMEAAVGSGRIVAFAFDLPLCVLMLRQGDPRRTEFIPSGDSCARPSHMAAETGPNDAGWVPFADLLSRTLAELVRAHMPAPVPSLSHLPGAAAGILVYSGDEDGAQPAWNDEELQYVAAAGGRMNLYIIPIGTRSGVEDVRRYMACHDVGPHPNLRGLDGRPVRERLAELERQIRMFEEMFGVRARSLRNHCTAWAGYMEPVEVMERLGVGMDTNYFSGCYMRARDPSPYAPFGAAMPMRFCRPDGRLLNVFQQHTHLADDVMFSDSGYSYRFSPAQFEDLCERTFCDIATRLHTPYTVCIHPSNWVKFSRLQGQELLRQALQRGMPVWSVDQWCGFWEARDTWSFQGITWDGGMLTFAAAGRTSHRDLCLSLPVRHAGGSLAEVTLDGGPVQWHTAARHRQAAALVPLPAGVASVEVRAAYR